MPQAIARLLSETRDAAANTCVACTLDAVLDAATFGPFACGDGFFDVARLSAPGDNCPSKFWLEVRNVDALYTTHMSDFRIQAETFDTLGATECGASEVHVAVLATDIGSAGSGVRFREVYMGGEACTPGLGNCAQNCRCSQEIEILPSAYSAAQGITSVRYGLIVDPSDPPVNAFAWASNVCIGRSDV